MGRLFGKCTERTVYTFMRRESWLEIGNYLFLGMHADIVYVLLLLINEMNSNVDSSMCMYIHIYS